MFPVEKPPGITNGWWTASIAPVMSEIYPLDGLEWENNNVDKLKHAA